MTNDGGTEDVQTYREMYQLSKDSFVAILAFLSPNIIAATIHIHFLNSFS